MHSNNVHKLLISLNTVCKTHAKSTKNYAPNINITKQPVKEMNMEIIKLMNYLKHPQFSYLNK